MNVQPTLLRDAVMSAWSRISKECLFFQRLVESTSRRIQADPEPKRVLVSIRKVDLMKRSKCTQSLLYEESVFPPRLENHNFLH